MLSASLDQHNPICGGRAWGRPQAALATTAYRLGSTLKCARARVVPALLQVPRNAAQIQSLPLSQRRSASLLRIVLPWRWSDHRSHGHFSQLGCLGCMPGGYSLRRTSENSVTAKFAEFTFHALGRSMLRRLREAASECTLQQRAIVKGRGREARPRLERGACVQREVAPREAHRLMVATVLKEEGFT
jgi:hypothetical protein